jgi:tetratricopeptide (TPR) repeat protein
MLLSAWVLPESPRGEGDLMRAEAQKSLPKSHLKRLIFTFSLIGILGITLWYFARPSPEPIPKSAEVARVDQDLIAPVVTNPGYLGSQACAACHAARFDIFKESRHHLACTIPNERTMPAAFNVGGTVESSEPSIRFAMSHEGDKYLYKLIQETPAGKRESTANIDLVYGQGGRFDEVYFTWRGNRLFELPVTWLHPSKEWGNNLLSPHQSGDFTRTTTPRCVECHTTWMGHIPGTSNEYQRETAILGVGCERCHGPGKDHVAFRLANPKGEEASSIVHPANLTRKQRIDLCAQCHSNTANSADLPFTHRPGEPLEKSYQLLPSRFAEDDHVSNQTKYMMESKCFQQSEMTCLTCHDPHKPTNHKIVADACLKCHQPMHCKEQPRLPMAVRENCTGCHMPARVWMNVHFHTKDERFLPPIRRYQHRIGVHPEATKEVLLAWEKSRPNGAGSAEATRLTKDLVGHWLNEAEKYQKANRFQSEIMAIREAVFFEASPAIKDRLNDATTRQYKLEVGMSEGLSQMAEKKYPAAMTTFTKLLEINPDSAKVHSRLGTLNGMLGKQDLAEKHLRKAGKEDPNVVYPFNMLGWMAYIQNRPAAAVPEFLKALEIAPADDAVMYRLGLAYLRLEKLPEARKTFERLYHLNPNHAGYCQGMSHVLRQQGEFAEAVRYARRAALLSESKVADILLSLCDAYADAGRREEAVASAKDAIRVAESPEVADRIRQRLQSLQPTPKAKIVK